MNPDLGNYERFCRYLLPDVLLDSFLPLELHPASQSLSCEDPATPTLQ